MSKILVKSVEQNINYLQSGEVKSGYMLRPVRYTTIDAEDLINSIASTSYVPKAFVSASLYGIVEAIENYLLNGHSIELPNLGIFSLSCESTVAKTAQEAGIDQFKKLHIKFRPSTSLKEKLDVVDVELDGVWKCLDLSADNKVYERITTTTNEGVELPDGDDNEAMEPNNPNGDNNNPGGNNPSGGGFEG